MVREAAGASGLKKLLSDQRINAVLLGPGQDAGSATKAAVEAAAKAKRALVLDAGAISSFTRESGKLSKLLKLNRIQAVLTPHDGEFARLFASDSAQILAIESKVERARAAAKALGAVLLLKGPTRWWLLPMAERQSPTTRRPGLRLRAQATCSRALSWG